MIQNLTTEQLIKMHNTVSLEYIEDDNSMESSLSLSHVHGIVIDELLEELFTHYHEFKKHKHITNMKFWQRSFDPYWMAIIRNVADVNGDGIITSDDFRLFLIVCCLKLTRLGMGELTFAREEGDA